MWWKMEKRKAKSEPSFIVVVVVGCIWAKVWKRVEEEASSSFNIKQVEQ